MPSTLVPRPVSILPDHIDFTDDGHVWWVATHALCGQHRPCKCGLLVMPHCAMICELERPSELARVVYLQKESDTFTIEVEPSGCGICDPWTAHVDSFGRTCSDLQCDLRTDAFALRVSAAPEAVMPIYDTNNRGEHPHAILSAPSGFFRLDRDSSDDDYRVELPAAAEPGMWAVKLRIVD